MHQVTKMTQITEHEIQAPLPLPDAFSQALTSIFEASRPAIVQVSTERRGVGTGIIWHRDGRIITNNHVVGSDDARVQVHLADGRTLDAQIIQRNTRLDLALLKVTANNLQALPIGDSSGLRIGEWAFAIGHPWGQRWVVTAGIISALSSVKLAEDLTTRYIKSDVSLAPGNSGGPLLNAEGQVVGMNAMVFGGDLSVSIPSNVITNWLNSLPQGRKTLGIEIQTIKLPISIAQNLQPARSTGLMVVGLLPERQALYTDLFIGDILLDVAGTSVADAEALRQHLSQHGDSVPMQIIRGGEVITITVATFTTFE
jgi:serine protease Do